MLKQTHTYEDYNGDTVTDVLYFNLTKTELAENMWIKEKVDGINNLLSGPEHSLRPEDVAKILAVVKDFMKLAYGVKSDDGKRFVKSDELWTEFTQSAAYDGFLFSLFENPDRANAFMLGLMPKDLAEAAAKASLADGLAKAKEITNQATDEVQVPFEEPKDKDPKDMTHDELLAAFKAKNQA